MSSPAKTAKPRLCGKTLGRRIAENRQLCLLPVIPVVITIIYKYIIPPFFLQNRVQIQAARADTAGKITNSFSSWLLRLKPYFLPSITWAASG